jgi:hypothetical protein
MTYRLSFPEALDRSRRFYDTGAEDFRQATLRRLTFVRVPDGYSRYDQVPYALGAAHQRRDTVVVRTHSASHKRAIRASMARRFSGPT